MPRALSFFLLLLVFLTLGISASGAEHERQIIFTERLWFSLQVQVTDGEGHITGFRWDGMSRKTRTLWDEGSSVEREEIATYDGVVQLTRTDPLTRETSYQYDALCRLEDVVYQPDTNGTSTHADNRHYEYDLVGNLLHVTYPNETAARQILRGVSQVFDKLNRLKEETSAGAAHVHTYDKAGNRRTTNYGATGRTLVSAYDKLNRLRTVTENGSSITSYGYDLNGNVTRKILPNGTESRCTFDALNRKLSETSLKSGGAVISSFDYSQAQGGHPSGYDKVGNILKIVEQYGHAGVSDRTVTNTYDRTYRLKTETTAEVGGNTTLAEYLYDKNCNRTEKKETINSGIPKIWTYSLGTTADGYNSNQIKSVADGTITTIFLYDLNGNRSSRTDGTKTQTYTWDYDNRLTQVVDSVLGTFAYTYDHRTRRVGRDESNAGGQIDELSFSGGLSVQEYQSNQPTPFVETIRGSDYGGGIGGILYTIRDGNSRSYNAYNSRGDVVSRTDDAAAITWQASYAAFGSETQEQGATLDRQASNTKDKDGWGANNEGHRYRDLEFDIYLSRDPLGHVDGPNEYVHVRQNPWTMFDPLGLASEHETKWQGVAADENRNFMTRIGASFMAAGEALNPFRSDSSIRQGGRDLQVGLAEGREELKKAPPGIRELGQLTLGVGSAGTSMLSVPAGLGEMGDSIQQQGAVNTGKQMVTGLVDHAMNNPVEFAGELGVGVMSGKAMLGSKSARMTQAEAKSRVFWSGSPEAKAGAEAFAKASGGTTLEMTLAGKVLDTVTTKQTYPLLKPLWDRASTNFAKGAVGPVDVFQSSKGVRLKSVWATKEFPVLFEKGNPVNYHTTK